jgi:hypothetical protein
LSRERRATLLEVALLALLVLAGAWREHRRDGVEMQYLTFVALLSVSTLRRVFAALTDVPSHPRAALALELAAFGGLATYPVAISAHVLAGLSAVLGSLPPLKPQGPARSPLLARALFFAVVATAAGAIVCGSSVRDRRGLLAAWPFAILALEALVPPRMTTLDETLPRTGGFTIVLALPAVHTHMGYRAQETECLLLVFSTIVALFALAEILLRLSSRGDIARVYALRRRVAFSAVACAVPLSLLWVAAELAFRWAPGAGAPSVAPIVNDGTQPFHAPGQRYVFQAPEKENPAPEELARNEFVWNQEGFHDRDHARGKPPSCLRVLLLGDSFVEGTQLRLEDLLHVRLEAKLRERTPPEVTVETLAFGYSGWGQVEELAALAVAGAGYAPDLVLLEFLPANDVANNYPELEADRTLSWLEIFGVVAAQRGLRFTALAAEKLVRVSQRNAPSIDDELFLPPRSPERAAVWRRAWERTDALIGEIAQASSRASSRLAVLIYPVDAEVRARAEPSARSEDLLAPARRMVEICARRGVPCLDLGPRFAKLDAEERGHLFLRGDGHWTRVAHGHASEEVTRFLADETPLWGELVAKVRGPR